LALLTNTEYNTVHNKYYFVNQFSRTTTQSVINFQGHKNTAVI